MCIIYDKNLLSYEHLLDIIINIVIDNKITPDKKIKVKKIYSKYKKIKKICDLEYYIKDLVKDFKIGNTEKNSLDDLIKSR